MVSVIAKKTVLQENFINVKFTLYPFYLNFIWCGYPRPFHITWRHNTCAAIWLCHVALNARCSTALRPQRTQKGVTHSLTHTKEIIHREWDKLKPVFEHHIDGVLSWGDGRKHMPRIWLTYGRSYWSQSIRSQQRLRPRLLLERVCHYGDKPTIKGIVFTVIWTQVHLFISAFCFSY